MASRKSPKATAVYRAGYSAPVEAAVALKELEKIRAANGGQVRPADVVDEARPKKAPLHPVFTWDDWDAAELWRQDEARRLVRSVHVVYEGQPQADSTPVYIHVRQADEETGKDQPGYREVASVRRDAELVAAAVADALAQLRGWWARYRWIAELSPLTRGVGDLLDGFPGGDD